MIVKKPIQTWRRSCVPALNASRDLTAIDPSSSCEFTPSFDQTGAVCVLGRPCRQLRLDSQWSPAPGAENGRFHLQLTNLGSEPLDVFTLAFTCLRAIEGDPDAENATLQRRHAYFHEVAPPAGLTLAPGARWKFSFGGLGGAPRHRGEGVSSAYASLCDGSRVDVDIGDLRREIPEPVLPGEGKAETVAYALLPWPREVELNPSRWMAGSLVAEVGSPAEDLAAIGRVDALFHRLFPLDERPFSFLPQRQDRLLRFLSASEFSAGEYRLDFFPDVVSLRYADVGARQSGLVALGQLLRGARSGKGFRFPEGGHISDRPRFYWRGCHLDTARRFYPPSDIARLIDILAYLRMNIFHWHLTDDEAWRLEIEGLPQLAAVGSRRDPDGPLLPVLGDGADGCEGSYGRREIDGLVAHAASLCVEIVPEIDVPGHCSAVLAALPELGDPDEACRSYVSAQGFFNNALNPALPATERFLETVLDAVVALFPSKHVHVGGDEVPAEAWATSPLANAMMVEGGFETAAELQAVLMRRIHDMLRRRGRLLVGWDEVANGGGIDMEGALLMAWRSPAIAADLAARGYDLIVTPAQAYYLDIACSTDWNEPGASWAGSTSLQQAYFHEVDAGVPEAHRHRLRGVQACIWSELIETREHFNHLVFPRLAAIAEAAWTPPDGKDWDRFLQLTWLCPRL